MQPRRDEKVLAVARPENRVHTRLRRPWGDIEDRAIRVVAIHRTPRVMERIARRHEYQKVETSRGPFGPMVVIRVGGPVEGIVDRVEVRALGDRGPRRVEVPIVVREVGLEPGRGLQ